MRAHPPAALDLLAMQLACAHSRLSRGADLPQRPDQVRGGGPRLRQHVERVVEIFTPHRPQREAVGRRDPDRGRTAYGHRPNRLGNLPCRAALELDHVIG
jgi:hypothetical protein